MSDFLPDFDALEAGDDSAWDQIYPYLLSVTYAVANRTRMTLAQDEAEDVARDALSQLAMDVIHGKRTHFGTQDSLLGGLKALAVKMTYRAIRDAEDRKRAIKRGHAVTDSLDELKERFEGDWDIAATAASRLSENEQCELIGLLHRLLHDQDWALIALLIEQVEEGLSYDELAKRHAMKTGTIGAKLSRGLAKIRERLKESPRLLQEFLDHFR